MAGFIGSALILIGMYMTGLKNKYGFALGLLGEVFWLIRGLQTGLLDLILLSAVFSTMHIHNFWKWTHDSKR